MVCKIKVSKQVNIKLVFKIASCVNFMLVNWKNILIKGLTIFSLCNNDLLDSTSQSARHFRMETLAFRKHLKLLFLHSD